MKRKNAILWILAAIIYSGGCTGTRHLTDTTSIKRQHEMRSARIGSNVGDVMVNLGNMIISALLGSQFEQTSSERAFKRITIINESTDSLYVNMVTDIVWKEDGYCDIMGIVLPAGARQKLLTPFPAAYNVYFRTPDSEEEKMEIRTDHHQRRIKLRAGMTDWINGNE